MPGQVVQVQVVGRRSSALYSRNFAKLGGGGVFRINIYSDWSL